MRRAILTLVVVTSCALNGCATPRTAAPKKAQADKPEAADKSAEKTASKRASLERKITVAELSLQQARLEATSAAQSSGKAVEHAAGDLALAQAKLTAYQTIEAPNRLSRKQLELQRARDSATEAQEELRQIEIMYEEQDLEDMTAEFVINRGKRNAERRKRSLQITERSLQLLTDHTIPTDIETRVLEVSRETESLAKARRSAEADELKKRIAVLNAESKLTELQEDLAELDEEKDK
jgi:hypothetical protein